MPRDRLDDQIDGQMSIDDLFRPPERLIAVSRVFARSKKEMNLAEQKTFVYALSQLDFTKIAETNIVYMDKQTLAKIIGIHSDANHLSGDLKRAVGDLPKHSYIKIDEPDLDLFDSGFLISRLTMFKNRVRLKFETDYLRLFTGLSTGYITMWSSDVFQMNSKRSFIFYEYLRENTDSRNKINQIALGVRALKEMFDIPETGKGSYMRDKEKGGFDRVNFERYVILPVCKDLEKTKMIRLVIQPNGKPYEKVKKGSRVAGYRFFWEYTSHPAIADAHEVSEIQERVDKNPQLLKVARDIIKGDKKQKSTNRFNNIGENQTDGSFLEKAFDEIIKQSLSDT